MSNIDDRFEDYDDYEDYARRRRQQEIGEIFEEEEEEEEPRRQAKARNGRPRESQASKRRSSAEYDDSDFRFDPYTGEKLDSKKSRRSSGSTGRKKAEENVKKKKKKKFPVLLLVVIIVLLAVIGIPLSLVASRFGNIHQIDDPDGFSSDREESVNTAVAESDAMDGYTNIALFGVDSREEDLMSGNNRSDMIMILSINDATGECRLVSLYRDTYLDIGDATYTKCNAAYAYGGPSQAVDMLNKNLDMNITDFVTIGFGGLADLIDAAGGVEIDVAEDEIHGINDYQSTMAEALGRPCTEITSPGLQTLTGLQAVAYCRIRYTTGDDFKRTERQREVLEQTFSKIKKLKPSTINAITTDVFSEIATSLTLSECLKLTTNALRFNISEKEGFPTADLRTTGMVGDQSCVIPVTLAANVQWLHSYLFDDSDYQVSDTVQQISSQVSANTGYY